MGQHHHQLTTTQRQLGYAHQRVRARLVRQWQADGGGWPCPYCPRLMLLGQDVDLDHATPRVLGGRAGEGRLAHTSCNRSHGAKLGAMLRQTRKLPQRRISSRRW